MKMQHGDFNVYWHHSALPGHDNVRAACYGTTNNSGGLVPEVGDVISDFPGLYGEPLTVRVTDVEQFGQGCVGYKVSVTTVATPEWRRLSVKATWRMTGNPVERSVPSRTEFLGFRPQSMPLGMNGQPAPKMSRHEIVAFPGPEEPSYAEQAMRFALSEVLGLPTASYPGLLVAWDEGEWLVEVPAALFDEWMADADARTVVREGSSIALAFDVGFARPRTAA